MSDRDTQTPPEYLPIGEVAAKFNVTVATVRNWNRAGKLTSIRTPGGQRRFKTADVEALSAPVVHGPLSETAGEPCAQCNEPIGEPHIADEGEPFRAWCSEDCRDAYADQLAGAAYR